MSKHIVVGAGPVGTATALRPAEQEEQVVVVTRSGSGPTHQGIGRTAADASSAAAMTEFAAGAVAIYNCANPAYHRWPSDWRPLPKHCSRPPSVRVRFLPIAAVTATVSHLYGYGPVSSPMTEDLPLAVQGPKALICVPMWRDALAAHVAGRVRVTEVRGSDYVGHGAQIHLGDRVVPRLLAGRDVTVTRSSDTRHTWTATDDVARLLVMVAVDERAWGRPGTCRATRHGASARLWATCAVSQESSQ